MAGQLSGQVSWSAVTAVACTSISSSPGPGSGTGMVSQVRLAGLGPQARMARIVGTELVTGCLPFWVRSRNKTRARRATAGQACAAKDVLGRAYTGLLPPHQLPL